MSKLFYRSFIAACGLILILTVTQSVTAQRPKIKKTRPKTAAIDTTDPEYLKALENLQTAKVYQLLAELQIGLATAYVENKIAGERSAKAALTKLDIELLRKPESLMTIYAHARGYTVWNDYLFNQHAFGTNAENDKTIKEYTEIIRKDVAKGSALDPNFPFIVAVRGILGELDCRVNINSSAADCYEKPLADLSRAIALLPDESDFFSLRAEFFERNKKTSLAEADNQTMESMRNAMKLKLDIDEQATVRQPFYVERAGADALYFMKIISLLNDENIKAQLVKDAAALKAFREKLLNYYALADASYAKANQSKPSADNLERRGMLRHHIGIFAADLGFEQPNETARKYYEEALGFYNEAIKLDARFAAAYQNRARIYRKLNKAELAEADEKQFALISEK